MSFGIGIGDCIAICQLANTLHERFADAPSQFKAISNEVAILSNVLQDIERVFSQQLLADGQKKILASVLDECQNVLIALREIVNKNYHLDPANVHGFRDKSRRVWKRLTLEPNDIQKLRSSINIYIGFLNVITSSVISKVTVATNDQVERLHKRHDARERLEADQAILDWLTPIDYAVQQQDVILRRQSGTGQWFLDSEEFRTWLDTDNQTLFCSGIPGAGKTILTAVTINDLPARFQEDPSVGIAYLYCDYKQKTEQRAQDLLASLLKQLSQGCSSLPQSVQTLHEKHKMKRTRPTVDEISVTLQSVASTLSRAIIVVDALDECQEYDRRTFLKEIYRLQSKTRANLFATSRLIPEIMEAFKGSLTLEIRANEEDMQRFLEGNISKLPKFVECNSVLQKEVRTGIVNAADGMFLLAKLHLESLRGIRSPKVLRNALSNLATGTDAYGIAYEEAMERIEGQVKHQRELAKQVLSWITCAKRPLTVSELQHALAVEIGQSQLDEDNLSQPEDLVSVCAGLVTIDEESQVIRLVHYTTQEYFNRTRNKWFPGAEVDITKTCVTYLSFDEFSTGRCPNYSELDGRLRSKQLYEYASKNWGHHARAALTLSSEVISEVIAFLKSMPHIDASAQALSFRELSPSYDQEFPKQVTGLHLAAYFGIEPAAKRLLQDRADIEAMVVNYGQRLLSGTPLHCASEQGQVEVVQLLLEQGASIEARDQWGQTPLHCASSRGQVEVVQLLLEQGASIEARDQWGQTPLHYTSEQGQVEVVQLLLEQGASIEAGDQWGQTPLHCASSRGQVEVVQLLLKQGASIEVETQYGWTLLHYASEYGQVEVVQLLLKQGASIEAEDQCGWTPLHYASSRGQVEVVQLLLKQGASIEAGDQCGQTPLYYASSRGQVEVVQLLLEQGASIEAETQCGSTPLHCASEQGQVEVVQLLLEQGASIEAGDQYGQTPLYYASSRGQVEVVQLLLEQGASIEAETQDGSTPLHCASEQGQVEVVQLLLEQGASIEARDQWGQIPLHCASSRGQVEVVQLLLEQGASIEARDQWGQTPLHYTSEQGQVEVVQLLLEQGASIEAGDQWGQTPLHCASKRGHVKVIELLDRAAANKAAV